MEHVTNVVMPSTRRNAFIKGILLLVILLICATDAQSVFAGRNGIASDGKDFFIGYMPGIKHSGSAWSNVFETYYVIIGSYNDNNQITINYFDATTGFETSGPQHTSRKGECWQQRIDVSHMAPQRPGEIAQWCAAHIKSTYPVSVQCYSEGSSAGGMLQAIPTAALGKNYVIASWYDNPIQNNPGFINRDSSSGEFMIIAPFDYTTVTYTPASTTCAGIVGVSSGRGSDGTEHPHTIILRRGQVFWVRSLSVDASFDISGSVVTADKPIAVLAGHERALLGDPSGIWTTLDNDVRDVLIEQMTPVEDWESEYPSIPMVPPPAVTRLLVNGTGEMYRVYTADPNGGGVDAWVGGNISPYTLGLTKFQNPIVAYSNITDPVDLVCHDGKKMYVVMYDYFQGQHDFDPGEKVGKGGSGGVNIQSGGGPTPQDETTYKMPSEMDVVPVNRWRKNAVWKVPQQSTYRGYQWINVLAAKDSFNTIQMSYNGAASKRLLSWPSTGPFSIPLHPELVGYQFQLSPGDYAMFSQNTPFVVYSYGRTQTQYKDGWAYAAPCGEAYGSRDSTASPKMVFTPQCGGWNLTVSDSAGNDEGIADIELLNDPQGVYARPARVSYNVSLNPTTPNFVVGDPVVSFQVLVNNPLQNAYAAIYVVDRAGNDTVYEFTYTAPSVGITPASASMKQTLVGADSCTTVVFHNNKSSSTLVVDGTSFRFNKGDFKVRSTIPAIPATLKPGDSLIANVCYTATDTGVVHVDSLIFSLACIHDTVPLFGSGGTPIIYATDADFGSVLVGQTVCKEVTVSNIGNAPLDLTTQWVLHNIINFKLDPASAALLPVVLQPGGKIKLTFCYTATTIGTDSTTTDWGTNLGGEFLHQKKDYSILIGAGTKPGVLWDRKTQPYTTVCDNLDTVRIYLYNNTIAGSGGAPETIDSVRLTAMSFPGEFTIVNDQLGRLPMDQFQLSPGDSTWVDVVFQANLANGFNPRVANLIAYTESKDIPTVTVNITSTVTHPQLAVSQSTIDFGLVTIGVPVTEYDTVSNPGNAPLVITTASMDNQAFTFSGIAAGDTIPPGGRLIVTIVGLLDSSGTAVGHFSANGLGNCVIAGGTICNIAANAPGALATGVDFNSIYTCQHDTEYVWAKNIGTRSVILHDVQILNAGTDTNASEFDFVANGAGQLTFDSVVAAGDSVLIKVAFHPSVAQASSAEIEYSFDTVLNSMSHWKIVDKILTGIGSNISEVTSLAPSSGQPYSVQTGGTFDVPITISTVFPTKAQVYGYIVNVSWRNDLFDTLGGINNITLNYGSIAPGTTLKPDLSGNMVLNLVVQGNVPMDNVTTLAVLHFKLMVAKDLQSSFAISQANFLAQNGNLICYINNSKVSGTFVPQDICGDSTLRSYIRNGQIEAQITGISPNPTSGNAVINYEVRAQNLPVTIEVYNMLGDLVQTIFKDEPHDIGAWRTTIDASKLMSGVYTVRFSTPNSTSTERIVINK